MDPVLKKLKKVSKNEHAFGLDDTNNPYLVSNWVDSGCYSLNAALSDGDILKGIPVGKRIQLAGPSGVAKSLFLMFMIKSYISQVDNCYVIAFESEGATISEMSKNYGIPEDRMIILPVMTVEQFKVESVRMLDEIVELRKASPENPPNFVMFLDSLGMLGTAKEYNDAVDNNQKEDMTRARRIRSIFRLLTLKLSLTQTTFFITNHTGANIGCLTKGHKILTPEGLKNIDEFKVGDLILTTDGESEVDEVFKYEDAECLEIEFDDGYKVTCTEDHKFLINDRWIKAKDLVIGDDAQEIIKSD